MVGLREISLCTPAVIRLCMYRNANVGSMARRIWISYLDSGWKARVGDVTKMSQFQRRKYVIKDVDLEIFISLSQDLLRSSEGQIHENIVCPSSISYKFFLKHFFMLFVFFHIYQRFPVEQDMYMYTNLQAVTENTWDPFQGLIVHLKKNIESSYKYIFYPSSFPRYNEFSIEFSFHFILCNYPYRKCSNWPTCNLSQSKPVDVLSRIRLYLNVSWYFPNLLPSLFYSEP